MKQVMTGCQRHQPDHIQIICTSLQTTMPALWQSIFFTDRMLLLTPNQHCQRQSSRRNECTAICSYAYSTRNWVRQLTRWPNDPSIMSQLVDAGRTRSGWVITWLATWRHLAIQKFCTCHSSGETGNSVSPWNWTLKQSGEMHPEAASANRS